MAPGMIAENNGRLEFRHHLGALVLYTVITLLLFIPFIMNMSGFDAYGDDAVFANAFWHFRHSLTEFSNPFFARLLFHPEGMNLVFHTTTYSNFLLTLPLNLAFGVNVAVNAAYLLTYPLAAYCTFLLAFELTGDRYAALVAGIIFSFSPFHFGQGRAHLHISTLQWLPLYILMLKRSLEGRRIGSALVAGVAFGLIILTDQLQTICATVVTLIVLAAALRTVGGDRRQLLTGGRQLLVIGIVAAVTASFYLVPLLRELLSHRAATKIPPLEHGGANMFSADLLGIFVPGHHRLWGGLFSSFRLGGDSVVYAGLVGLSLAAIGWQRCRAEFPVRWLLLTGVVFWVLSLGPYLHVNGVWEFGSFRITLPYLYMIDIPLLGENRTPGRFHMITQLAVALLAAYGVRELFRRPRAGWGRPVLAAIMGGMILLDTLPPSQSPGTTPAPLLYQQISSDPRTFAVLQLPLSRWSALMKNGSESPASMMYFQTIHGKPIFSGLASRLVSADLDFKDNILDLLVEISMDDHLRARQKVSATPSDIASLRRKGEEYAGLRDQFLRHYRIGAIVVHPPISGNTMTRAFLEGFLNRPLLDCEDGLAFAKTVQE